MSKYGTIDGWNTFIDWAKWFYERPEFEEEERTYKLQIAKDLASAKEALINGAPDWLDLLKLAIRSGNNNLTNWRANQELLDTDEPVLKEALLRVWGMQGDSSLEGRVKGFHEMVPTITPSLFPSFLLMAEGAEQYPIYQNRVLRDACKLTGYPSYSGVDAWGRYNHMLGFYDEFIQQSCSRGLQLSDRLDAQSLVWSVTRGNLKAYPEEKESMAKLDAYRKGMNTSPPQHEPLSIPAIESPWSLSKISTLAQELLWDPAYLQEIIEDLQEKRQVIFYGPPGTGKTYVAQAIAQHCKDNGGGFEICQFHPSYSYEDFMEGFRPTLTDNGQAGFKLIQGPLRRIAEKARARPEADFILIIDELNRGNVAKVFGELYFLLEYRDKYVRLQYGGDDSKRFRLPPNLWFICTMNTADRSIALMDAALRRRFYFAPFFPNEPPIEGLLREWLKKNDPANVWVADLVDRANEGLERDSVIGPSYFMVKDKTLDERRVRRIWNRAVIPYVEEQCFGDDKKLKGFNFDTLKGTLAGTDAAEVPDSFDDETAPLQANDNDADA